MTKAFMIRAYKNVAFRRVRGLKLRPFHVHIGTVFVLLTLAILLAIGWVTQLETRKMVQQSTEKLFNHVGYEVVQQVRLLRGPVESTVQLLASMQSMIHASSYEKRMENIGPLVKALETESQIAAIYYAYGNGEFFLVRSLHDQVSRLSFKAPAEATFLVQSVEDGGKRHRWVALAKDLTVLTEWSPQDHDFDPRARPWYKEAAVSNAMIRTQPYVFSSTGRLGRTVAVATGSDGVVVGADMRTETLSTSLSSFRVTASSELAIFGEDGHVVAFHDPSQVVRVTANGQYDLANLAQLSPVMARLDEMRDEFQTSRIVEVAGREWSLRTMPLMTEVSHEYLALATPVDELMADVYATQRYLLALLVIAIILSLPIVWLTSKRIANQLRHLTAQAAAIRRFDFGTEIPFNTSVQEIFDLNCAFVQMKETIRKFLEVSKALAAERSFDKLLGSVLREIRLAAGSDGGIVYLLDEDTGVLKLAAQRWTNEGAVVKDILAGLALNSIAHPCIADAGTEGSTRHKSIGSPRPDGLEYLDERYGVANVEMIVTPLLGRAGNLVGVVCNFMLPGQAVPSPERMAFVEAFAGAAAVAIDQQRLMQAQKSLLKAIISVLAGAIDAKSPYTGGHCQRVPVLTEMLTRAAHDSRETPFAEFHLDEDEWEALHIAAGLHDCGKVTTPEYVVDKATKLETIYNRIHEIRMRFEVIKRDLEIETLRAIMVGGDSSALNDKLARDLQVLDEQYQFLAACNEGGEYMSPDKIGRLKEIANRTWQRTLDDRIGISWEEQERLIYSPGATLPVTEQLLADKPEHIVRRPPSERMPEDNPWGFKLNEPEHLYNRGEITNLSISRGTLSEEERFKINHHMVQTIIMLSQLPFPKHLKNVQELAGGHHEKMDGTGYPKRLRREEMSLPARIMAIADIFEALTAADRPYKSGKRLSEAVKIMGFMVKDQHIDPELFKLFLRSGVYRTYAEKYMRPELVDEVEIDRYL